MGGELSRVEEVAKFSRCHSRLTQDGAGETNSEFPVMHGDYDSLPLQGMIENLMTSGLMMRDISQPLQDPYDLPRRYSR